jgi:transcriptional regulator with XRE-family HTH domain
MTTPNPISGYREKHGLTVGQLAERLDVDRTTIWRWETARSRVPVRLLDRVEAVTGVRREQLRPDVFRGAA